MSLPIMLSDVTDKINGGKQGLQPLKIFEIKERKLLAASHI